MVQRYFIPGSEWLYFKLYTGHKTADELLVNRLQPFLNRLYAANTVDKHYFIRYADPDFHLRLRLHIPAVQDYGRVFDDFCKTMQPCIDGRLVSGVMCDTYKREIERYGADSIEQVESLFWTDSQAVVGLLARIGSLPAGQREVFRWQMALVLLDQTFDAFGYGLPEKRNLMHRMAESFKNEFGFTAHRYTKQLNDKYREVRPELEPFFASALLHEKAGDLLCVRQSEMRPLALSIRQMEQQGRQVPPIDDVVISLHHMTMNRWFRSRNRQHEMVIYEFLTRHYDSRLARKPVV